MKKSIVILTFSLAFAWMHSSAQQPVLSVQSCEYVWDKISLGTNDWLKIPEADSLREDIKNCFARAIHDRWNIEMPAVSMSVKSIGLIWSKPPFNTKLKNKQPGTWYMFLQVFSNKQVADSFYDNSNNLSVILRLRCRIINGANDSLVLDRDLTVRVYTQASPPGQVVLTRLPAYPAQFVHAFDSIATWLFAPEMESQKSITLMPACIFTEPSYNDQPLAQFEFACDDTSIHLLTQPPLSFKTPRPSYRKTGTKRNIGSNIAATALTLLTTVDFGGDRTRRYRADYPFETDTGTFHCLVNFEQWEVRNGGERTVASISIDSGFIQAVTYGEDTIATFRIMRRPNLYTNMWDGADSATIMPLPKEWNNEGEDANVFMTGTIGGDTFLMQSSKERTAKNFFVNGRLALTVYGKSLPSKALLFQQLSLMQMKVFTILSSLP